MARIFILELNFFALSIVGYYHVSLFLLKILGPWARVYLQSIGSALVYETTWRYGKITFPLSFSSMTVFSAIHDYDSLQMMHLNVQMQLSKSAASWQKYFNYFQDFLATFSHSKSATVFENHIKSLIASERATFYILRWWKMPKNSKIQKRHFGWFSNNLLNYNSDIGLASLVF